MTDPTSRLNAALEGRYRIERELGEGGMANVYLAADLKHDRKVALKVLKPELAAVVGAERFLAEIKTTANLQHPNILPLFDSGEADTFLFYVMPYVEGESLRDRLDRERQLPVDEAVRIAVSVANALDHAHRKGVVHRDIKPANIMLQDGEPVVADFGIALAVNAGQGRLTETGLSIGSPFYMSPEQATGDRTIAPSSDIYSLACVLYELLAGEPPHSGGTAQAVLGSIIAGVPVDVRERRPTVPTHVDSALRKALEKIPPDRFATADLFAKALSDDGFRYGDQPAAVDSHAAVGSARAVVLGMAGVTAVAVLIAGWALTRGDAGAPQRVLANELTLGPDAPEHDLRGGLISADGSLVVYSAGDSRGIFSLFVRESDEVTARQIPNTEGALYFTLSPSGEEVAFTEVSLGPLRVVSISGEGERTVAARAQATPVWGADHIYFMNPDFGISRVPVSGGEPEIVTPHTEEPVFRLATDILPQNDAILFTETRGGDGRPELYLLSLLSGEISFLAQGSVATYADGFLIYTDPEGNQIMAAPFDLKTLQISGNEVALLSGLGRQGGYSSAMNFTVGVSGDLVYAEASRNLATAVWVDRAGVPSPIDPDWKISPRVAVTGLDLSHDGTRLATASDNEDGSIAVWAKDLQGGPAQRMTFDPPINTRPFWGPNDDEIFYFRDPDGGFLKGNLIAIPSDGSGRPREVLTDVGIGSGSWGAGHEWMIYRVGVPARASRDIYGLESGDSEPQELVATAATEQAPSLSPDGRWLLYQSDRSGEHDVFVRPFPNVDDGLVQISLTGGTEPQWDSSGDEIYYRDAAGQMMSAQIDAGAALRVTSRDVLFDASPYWSDPASPQYDVAPDGQRFIMLQREPGATSLVVVWNWLESVKARFEDGND